MTGYCPLSQRRVQSIDASLTSAIIDYHGCIFEPIDWAIGPLGRRRGCRTRSDDHLWQAHILYFGEVAPVAGVFGETEALVWISED